MSVVMSGLAMEGATGRGRGLFLSFLPSFRASQTKGGRGTAPRRKWVRQIAPIVAPAPLRAAPVLARRRRRRRAAASDGRLMAVAIVPTRDESGDDRGVGGRGGGGGCQLLGEKFKL